MTNTTHKLGLFYDPAMIEHRPQAGHPERPERLTAVVDALRREGIWDCVTHLPTREATRDEILRVHKPQMLDLIHKIASSGGGTVDGGDTDASPGSWRATKLAAGAAIGAVDAVLDDEVSAAFALARPPGHHATPSQSMGFCLLNNAAIAAAHAIHYHHLSRILLVDFDVHHGNGTQDAFYNDPRVLYFSTHQDHAYPGTGSLHQTGEGGGKGFTVNVPLPSRVGDDGYAAIFEQVLSPLAYRFQPQIIFVSAGYDTHWRNSRYVNGIDERMQVTGFHTLATLLQDIANTHCPGKLAGVLEGGYDLDSLGLGLCNTLRAWMREAPVEDTIGPPPGGVLPAEGLDAVIRTVKDIHGL